MNLDDMIRDSLAEHEHDLPGDPDSLASVTARVRHRRDTRAAIAVGIAVIVIALAVPLALTGLGGTAAPARPEPSTSPTGTSPTSTPTNDTTDTTGTSVVTWLDSPASEPTQPTVAPLAAARACTGSDLAATATIVTGAPGISEENGVILSVRNIGTSRCTLTGHPAVFYAASGHKTVRPSGLDGITAGGIVPATVDPGQSALVRVSRGFACNNPQPGIGDSVTANGVTWAGKDIRFPTHSFSGVCTDFMVSAWYTNPPDGSFPAYPWDALTASIDPSQAHLTASTLYFTVTLTNPTDTAITLTPCPVYGLAVDGPDTYYTLNCAAAPPIPAHGSVEFAMQADVSGEPTGTLKVGWDILSTPGQPISATMEVLRITQ